jgi:catechol 2,3-dioxygenase
METNAWPVRSLGLKVLDLPSEVAYYERLGLRLLESSAERAVLGFEDKPVLELRLLRDGRRRPSRSAGLYHFALLLPDVRRLGQFLWRVQELGIPLDGASDHLVSQALYLSDPEGNGIEVYADRPSDGWDWTDGQVAMTLDPFDFEGVLREATGVLQGFPAESRLGHMHITVGDLDRSVDFYKELGMDLTAGMGPMRFTSWDRYHHHLGINLLNGPGADRVEDDVAGLDFFEIARPDLEPGTIADPDGIKLRLTP